MAWETDITINESFQCLLEMLNHAPFLCTTEIESVATLCFRAFEGSNYEVRCTVAKLLGALVATTQQPAPKGNNPAGKARRMDCVFH